MTTHERIVAAVAGARAEHVIGVHTVACLDNTHGHYIKLYDTIILSSKRGVVTVNSGGHRTRLTLARINHFLGSGWQLVSHQGNWGWRNAADLDDSTRGVVYPYREGDQFSAVDGLLPCSDTVGNHEYRYGARVVENLTQAQAYRIGAERLREISGQRRLAAAEGTALHQMLEQVVSDPDYRPYRADATSIPNLLRELIPSDNDPL